MLPFPRMGNELEAELRGRFNCDCARNATRYGDLLYAPNFSPAQKNADSFPYWCRQAMVSPFLVHFDSIGEAAGSLKGIQRNWSSCAFKLFRRCALIQEKLPYINLKAKKFPFEIPSTPMGLFTLLDEKTMLASAETTSDLPGGQIFFEENHVDPPSRAYLKLWEALCAARHSLGAEIPGPGAKCLDAGASPGGWTWALLNLGCEVLAVDRAPLSSALMENPRVKFLEHDAFTLAPGEVGEMDWVFCDVICYPRRLLGWIHKWLESALARNMVCTIKMQGDIDYGLVGEFASIKNSRTMHLNANKRELTWLWRAPS